MRRSTSIKSGLLKSRLVVVIKVMSQEFRHAIERDIFDAEDLADVTDRGLGSVADEVGDHRGAMASVALVDPLDDLLSALMFNVEIDVGGLCPLLADKTLKEEIHLDGIYGGDA